MNEQFPHFISSARGVPDGYPHHWAYSGACVPGGPESFGHATFSVGIYPVLPCGPKYRARGRKLKRGKAVKRIRGTKRDDIFKAAEEWIARKGTP